MSVAQLHPGGRVRDAVPSARAAMRAAAAVPVAGLDVDELTDALVGAAALEGQAAALRLSLLAEADARKVAQSLGVTGTDAWAARLTGANRAETANLVRWRGGWRRPTTRPGTRSPPVRSTRTRSR
ncbi:hypothetical protein KRR39_17605 [Nocardioides panacis]|uniref:DUF222 domain-containing protein n=1 Tax=Nocardioides panacis TaxID=2849501 RepID=A0A975T4F1_9ACTN|nr:hypothetical protein [Nocardioides panacis]QWZ10770.1 hypothetical protein KRR39_17605 [Nocardioides panacis]